MSNVPAQQIDPGDALLRHDLELLASEGLVEIPLTTWPLPVRDVRFALAAIDATALQGETLSALLRSKAALPQAASSGKLHPEAYAGAAVNPVAIRTFADSPRDEAEIGGSLTYSGTRLSGRLQVGLAANPFDGETLRFDGSFVATELGNWLVSAGWQERWWGPGHAGSMILSSNARPLPAIALQRIRSVPFESRWLQWMGQWSLTTFVGEFTGERVIDDALLFGLRATFRPLRSLEVGISRTAQWCGSGRSCSGRTFVDMLLGRDNRGVNVSPEDEPGNQLAGVDLRWRLPTDANATAYIQWIGEDTRRGGPEIGSWLRLAGLEWSGMIGPHAHRGYFEIAETSCRRGGLGFSGINADCGYEHSVYQTGYRHLGRSLGHGIDGDGFSYSAGSTLVQSPGYAWTFLLRHLDINRVGEYSNSHTLSPAPKRIVEVQVSHSRSIAGGDFEFWLGWQHSSGSSLGYDGNGLHAALRYTVSRW